MSDEINKTEFSEIPSNGSQPIAAIQLRGEPYVRFTNGGEQISMTEALEELSVSGDYESRLVETIEQRNVELAPLYEGGYYPLDAALKSRDPLTYEQAYSLIAMVCMTSNNAMRRHLGGRIEGYDPESVGDETLRLHATSLLQGMSVREAIIGLQPQEIAGMIAATVELDTIARVDAYEPAFAMGGMGGDKGLRLNGSKTKFFSISTMSGLALGQFGLVHKHDSYPNTSKVAGQTAREALGARSDIRSEQRMSQVLSESRFIGTSCHSTRTLHTISHRLKGETVNHVIGPGAFPHSAEANLHPFIGVNHNVHPATFMQAMAILTERGVQQYPSGVAVAGLDLPRGEIDGDLERCLLDTDSYYRDQRLKDRVMLDELAPPPYASMASFLVDGEVVTCILEPEDFMTMEDTQLLRIEDLAIPNTSEAILTANEAVIMGTDEPKVRYAAMTVALARFTKDLPQYRSQFIRDGRVNREILREYYYDTVEKMLKGGTDSVRMKYVDSSQRIR